MQDLPVIKSDGQSGTLTMDLSKWLEPGTSSIKARVVGVDSATDDIAYSEPRYFEVRNQDRYYVDMIQPMGRRALLRFSDSF